MTKYLPAILLLAVVMAGCPAEEVIVGGDTGASPDAESQDVSCETSCDDETVFIDTGARRLPFTRAAYGLSSPEQSASGEWEVYVEAWEGGFTGCPAQDSSTPVRQVILSGLRTFVEGEVQSEAEGVTLTLLDFQGDLITSGAPFSRASHVRVLPMSWELCTECVGEPEPSHEDGEIVLRLEATFEEGELEGEVVARHCDSLDLP